MRRVKLSRAGRAQAEELLAWDLARVSVLLRRGFGVGEYLARHERAAAVVTAETPVDAWPRETLDLLMTLLEVNIAPTPAVELGVGPLQYPVPPRDPARLRSLAGELNLVEALRAVSPSQWEDSK